MLDKDLMRRAKASVWGALLLVGAIAWAVHETTLLEGVGSGPRWYLIRNGTVRIDESALKAMQTQLAAAAAAAPEWPATRPGQAPRPEVVQMRDLYGGYGPSVVFVLGSCESSTWNGRDLRARLLPVRGGGACSFSAEYDLRSGRYRWFRFNDIEAREPTGDPRWHQVRGGDWWVDRGTMAAMRAPLEAATNGHPVRTASAEGDATAYTIQFRGRMRDGRRVVEIVGTCGKYAANWDLVDWTLYLVKDGGDCYFDAWFDPTHGVLERFSFNGVG